MMQWFQGINWIASIVGAIVLSVVANLLTPWVQNWWAQRSRLSSARRIEELKATLEELAHYRGDGGTSFALASILRVLALIALASVLQDFGGVASLVPAVSDLNLNITRASLVFAIGVNCLTAGLYVVAVNFSFKAGLTLSRLRNYAEHAQEIGETIKKLEASAQRPTT